MSGGNYRLNLNQPVPANESVWTIPIRFVIKETAVIHVDEVHLFVQHASDWLLFVAALHMVVCEAKLRLAPFNLLKS
ncbi:Uncharacterised protein [Klebsiella pneumoniae]|nr:Uncharacterised protein [Klebsiella pneumoniae]